MSPSPKPPHPFQGRRVLVVGDVMLDTYVRGRVARISPEAPVPVLQENHTEHRLGGAANVALNLHTLGAEPLLLSVCGTDSDGDRLQALLQQHGLNPAFVQASGDRITTAKTRFMAGQHQLLRLDREEVHPPTEAESQRTLEAFGRILQRWKPEVILFEDYDKGTLSTELVQEMLVQARRRRIPTAVDPKRERFLHFEGCTLFKPNLRELQDGIGFDTSGLPLVDALKKNAKSILTKTGAATLMVTLSDKGIFWTDGRRHVHEQAHLRTVADVSGAGDTVIAVAACCLAAKIDPETMARLCNLAGGLVCESVGVVPLTHQQLWKEARRLHLY